MPYTGNLAQTARYPTVALSAPIHDDHAAGAAPDDADMWGGQAPAGPGPDWGSPGLWVDREQAPPQSGSRPDAQSHVSLTGPRMDANRLGWVMAQQAGQAQMLASHAVRDAGTDLSLPRESQFQFLGQRNAVDRQQGQRSWEPGLSGPLARGRNSYAQNNPPTEVYGGEGMRYGYDTLTWGEYRTPLPMAMKYGLRAVGMEQVHFPVDTPPVADPSMRSSFSSGTQTARNVLFNVPRMYAPPSSTSISDATMAAQGDAQGDGGDGFASDGWG